MPSGVVERSQCPAIGQDNRPIEALVPDMTQLRKLLHRRAIAENTFSARRFRTKRVASVTAIFLRSLYGRPNE